MAAGFRRGGKDMELEELKAYCRIDYDDDDEVIKLIYAAVLEEMTDLIKDFNPEALTNRQKLLICMYVKEAYDNRDRTAPTDNKVRFAVRLQLYILLVILSEVPCENIVFFVFVLHEVVLQVCCYLFDLFAIPDLVKHDCVFQSDFYCLVQFFSVKAADLAPAFVIQDRFCFHSPSINFLILIFVYFDPCA
jgi:uncharacterized phage protein (predicted DNA packaging)